MPIKNVPNTSGGKKENVLYLHARIRTGETKVRIEDLDGKVENIVVTLDSMPALPKLPTKFTLDECSVIFDTDNEKVLAINPYVGVVLAVGRELGPRPDGEDGEPKARVSEPKIGNDNKEYTTKNFYEIFEVVDENNVFYGSKPRLFLQDKFINDGTGMVAYSGTDASKWTVRLSKFGQTQGLFDEDITWPKDGNVLPELERRILNNERVVQLVFDGGFINTILPVQQQAKRSTEEVSEPVDEVDAEFAKSKKAAKKGESDEWVKEKSKPLGADDDLDS